MVGQRGAWAVSPSTRCCGPPADCLLGLGDGGRSWRDWRDRDACALCAGKCLWPRRSTLTRFRTIRAKLVCQPPAEGLSGRGGAWNNRAASGPDETSRSMRQNCCDKMVGYLIRALK